MKGVHVNKYICKVKFKKGKIYCFSKTKCVACSERDKCEDLDIYIKSPYEDIKECMKEPSYKRVNGRIKQK